MKDRGGHFDIQNVVIKLHDPDCYHINYVIMGIISLLKNMVRLCPSTGK